MTPRIKSEYIGRRPYGWTPPLQPTSTAGQSQSETMEDETSPQAISRHQEALLKEMVKHKQPFLEYAVRRCRMRRAQIMKKKGETARKEAEAHFGCFTVLVFIIFDPSSTNIYHELANVGGGSQEDLFAKRLDEFMQGIENLWRVWSWSTGNCGGFSGNIYRGMIEKEAQMRVPLWYDKRCVLTGGDFPRVEGVPILNSRAALTLDNDNMKVANLWEDLSLFWPCKQIENLKIRGQEIRNVLPLHPQVESFWLAKRSTGLRPIEHPTDPDHKLYLQVICFEAVDRFIGYHVASQDWPVSLQRVDLAAASEGFSSRLVRHGDVYMLTTDNPKDYPLPNLQFLQMRYVMDMIGFCGSAHSRPGIDGSNRLLDQIFRVLD